MREIKFRAWDGERMWTLDQMFVGVGQIGFSDEHYVDLNADDHETVELMQYTGLKDKNGVEIYEGDIIRVNDEYKYGNDVDALKVYYNESGGFSPFVDLFDYDGMTFLDCYSDYEVIGNIYENPELAK
jgi:uncharacterized phage protein (TIGR01671 family)